MSKSSDYFEDGSSVYANWEEGSPKAFGWRFTLEGLRACVDYGHPSPTEEELMIEYRMYDESSRDVGDIVTFGLCEYCDLFICSRRRKARFWICWYKVNILLESTKEIGSSVHLFMFYLFFGHAAE